MECYRFQPFVREDGNCPEELSIPELTDGFDSELVSEPSGMLPVSFWSGQVPAGIYEIHIILEACRDIDRLYLFTGRKQLREIVTLRRGERFASVYYQSAAEIIPRFREKSYPEKHLFFTFCTEDREAVRLVSCHAKPAQEAARIFLCGDSTVTDHSCAPLYHPGACYAGWGQALPAFLSGALAVENQAHCGLTTEAFEKEGHFAIVKKYIRRGELCLIQFAHNDQKLPHLLADRQFPQNLRRYVDEIREKEAVPVLVTPLARNIWNSDGQYLELLEEHTCAVKKTAKELSVPCIDLHKFSADFIRKHGMERSRSYFHPDDYTHTNEYGAYLFGRFMAEKLSALFSLELKKNLPAFVPPENLWETLSAGPARMTFSSQREKFDSMEKSTAALLEAIAKAKQGGRIRK